jgi:hypothetical protein
MHTIEKQFGTSEGAFQIMRHYVESPSERLDANCRTTDASSVLRKNSGIDCPTIQTGDLR